ncbi:uncharacterized protein K02A2.6-like [Stylophora pistillata]|uniref:uncharacterized protein K02A2.6-like n=1 Tax=Stylophora pistillata TaxID=50429 RepID=UPI000C04ADA1|nr:uncharacterized protein K02A2.6-like [Stylophora pistillata]
MLQKCEECQLARNKPPTAPLHSWEWPKMPWQRIYVDFGGPFMGKMFLVVVGSHSKWLEVETMPNVTSPTTIDKLRHMFARFGLPSQLVNENGPQFTSKEFPEFMKQNGIKHILVSPYHPRSNGLVKRFVETFKKYFKTVGSDSVSRNLARFLLSYRTTPSSVTDRTPAELFLNRRPRTRLDLMHPDLRRKVSARQEEDKGNFDNLSRDREFSVGEEVSVENFRGEPNWLEGTVVERTSPVSYEVQVDDKVWKRRTDQLREKSFESTGCAPAIAIDDTFEQSRNLAMTPAPVSHETPQTLEEKER